MPRENPEERLYAPTVKALKNIFDFYYCDQSQRYSGKPGDNYRPQCGLIGSELRNPYLWITAHGDFPEELKRKQFNYYMFEQLHAETLHPDILGYVVKNTGKKPSPPETIAVEIKAHELTLRDLMQAKLYETFFETKHTFLLSPQGMPAEKMKVVLKHGDLLRGHVIIGKCHENGNGVLFDPELVYHVSNEFKPLCNPTKYHSKAPFARTLEEAMAT